MADELMLPRTRFTHILNIVEPVLLVALPVFMVICAILKVPNLALITSIGAVVTLIPFFAHFELSKMRARDLMPIVVMTALGVAGRLIFAPVPAIKPVMAIAIITGLAFGRQSGFITGSLIMLASNIFFGQGPWTPWQMYGMGLGGYIAGSVRHFEIFTKRIPVAVMGFLLVYLYGFILDTWTLVGFVNPITVASAVTTYTAGAIYNLAHATGTVVFLLPIATSWPKIFNRIKLKYGIGMPDYSPPKPLTTPEAPVIS